MRLARHYSQCAPCGPGRASLYTGLYQMNHRVVANGTPLDRRFDNIALAARRAGYAPTLFGYTDQSIDPRDADGPDDPRLSNYEGVLPGFEIGCDLSAPNAARLDRVAAGHGHTLDDSFEAALRSEPERPAEHSLSAFLVGELIDWTARQDRPWFAHLSQLRPHPPYAAAGHFSKMYDPDAMPAPIPPTPFHALHERMLGVRGMAAPLDAGADAPGDGPVLRHDQRGRRPTGPACAPPWKPRASGTTPSSSSPPTMASSWATTA